MKNIIPYFLLICVLVLYAKELFFKYKSERIREKPKTEITIEAEEVARQVDSQGAEHVIYKEAEPIIKLIELQVEDKAKVDSLLKLANIKDKQLRELQTTVATISEQNIELRKTVKGIDTIYEYHDKYLDLSFNRKSDDLVLGSFGYNLILNDLQYWKRDWFLGKKKGYIEVWSPDSRVRINGMGRVAIKQKTPTFNVGAGALSTYANDAWGYGGGLRIGVSRLSVTGGYLYYPMHEEWKPSISAYYDLIRF